MPYVAPKTSTDLLGSKICLKLHVTLVLLLKFFTIFWCISPSIMLELRTNFCSHQISTSFWRNMGQNFLECRARNFSVNISFSEQLLKLNRFSNTIIVGSRIETQICIFLKSCSYVVISLFNFILIEF